MAGPRSFDLIGFEQASIFCWINVVCVNWFERLDHLFFGYYRVTVPSAYDAV